MKRSPLLLLVLAFGCTDLDVDDLQDPGRTAPGPTGVLTGTVLYSGPKPVCGTNEDGDPVPIGSAILTLFAYDNPPPPTGTATTSLNLLTIPGDAIFDVEDCLAEGETPSNTPFIVRTAAFAWPELTLGGDYQIRAYYDYDGNFNPFFSVSNLPTQGDVAGGAFVDPNAPIREFRRLSFESAEDRPNGQVINGVSVALGAPVSTERPVFYMESDPLNSAATLPLTTDSVAREAQILAETNTFLNLYDAVDDATSFEVLARAFADAGMPLDELEGFAIGDVVSNYPHSWYVRPVDANGDVNGPAGNIEITGQSAPVATTSADLDVNLNPADSGAGPWDPLDPSATSDYQSSMTVYDSLGNSHDVQMFFVNNGGGAWEWHAMVDGSELNGGTPDQLTEIADGTLTFDTNGQLDTETLNASSADFNGATAGQAIQFDFGDAITTDGGNGSGSTQVAGESVIESVSQDGREPGELLDIITSDDGTVSGLYSNGETEPMAKMAIASFRAPENLQRQGDQLWVASRDSGQALLGEAGTAGRGSVASNALEGSNVDLGDELVTLIAYQRAFQANARTISTADEMLTEVANLKR